MMLRSSGIINRVKWGFIGVVFIVAQFGPLSLLTNIANAASPSVNLDQWATDNAQWVNGNVNPSKASLREGDSLPYRARFGSLTAAQSYTIQISWDITKGGKHALDYLTTYNRTFTANPCIGVSGCLQATNDTETIPADPNAPAMQVPGVFTLFGGAITSLSAYSMTGNVANDATAYISITFTANVDNPVLAWAGHIASQVDWGFGKSASAVNGSPYHTNLTNFSAGGVGQQDRSLSAAAVYPTPEITTQIYKNSNSLGSNGTIYIGESIKDFATVSKVDRHDPTPSGTVKFYVCYDSANYPDCVTGGNIIGASVALSGGTASSASYTPSNLGYYCVRAQYTPASDAPYSPQNHTNLTTECFRVLPLPNGNLTVTKIVNNMNGGTANISDFELFVNSTQVSSGQQNSFAPGSYTISETQQDGYMLTDVSGSCKKDVYGKIKVDVTSNGSSTCTLTNTDIAPKLTLKKDVKNDNGGTATPDQWTVTATPIANSVGATAISGNGDDGVNSVKAKANVEYILSETGPSGYEFKGWSCNGGSLNGTKLTLELDSDVTCTVTNDDIAPKLTLIKKVENNDGGNAYPKDWVLKATGPTTISGSGGVTSDESFKKGEYTLSEYGGPYGYVAGEWSCVGANSLAGDVLEVGLGDDISCTITNDDQKGTLIVKKIVVNDDGGKMTAGDFSVTINGNKSYDFEEDLTDNEQGEVKISVPAGHYTVVEDQEDQYGYDTDYDTNREMVCDGVLGDLLSRSYDYDCLKDCEKLYVGNGQTVVCTITNDDIAPHVTLKKQVVNNNSGVSESRDWTLSATPANGSKTISGNGEDGVVEAKAKANVEYLLSENGPSGYKAGSWYCEGGQLRGNVLTLGLDEDAYCVIENNDIEHPGINVVKSGPSNAQTGETVVYTFTVTNTGDTPLSGVVVNDNIAGKGVYKSGDFNNNSYLDLTETWIYTANYVIPQSAVGATVNNTVKACGDMVSNDTNWYDASDSQIVCDDDSHSLKVAAAELVNTGAGSTPLMSILLAVIMLAGAITTSRRSDGARQ